MQTIDKIPKFDERLQSVLKKLRTLPIDKKSDEVSVPAYLHKNFLVRKIFQDRIKAAYRMTSFTDKTVLDYGCGSGIFLESLSQEISKGIGLDLDIEIAKKIITSKNITLAQIKNENDVLQFENIDIITSFDVLEHVHDLDSLVEGFNKILRPGGFLIISGPTENSLYGIARKIAGIGIKGNLKGKEEHVRNIFNIKDKILGQNFEIQNNISLWNLFHVIGFKKKNTNSS